ncbi:Solute carrier family 15 member 2 [Araneus ventricosus]|uniref:Solute carrier family 15 member 2 n=1 Tax=Araneus ventricosus TaxID=182803 RepID=A0A4Y2FM17_ARAVE|nr:Solute carrier family 15 member 2 [Araneus ventricosus]
MIGEEVSEQIPEEHTTSEELFIEGERERKLLYPRGVVFLLIHRLWDAFGTFVILTVLTIYLINELDFSESTSHTIFHVFTALFTFSPVAGALLADAYLSKFWTVFYLSILYTAGEVCLFIGSTLMNISSIRTISLLSLLIIALANGGLKPCASAFGGDQFDNTQALERKRFFTLFFFIIYLSQILAAFISPILRSHVECFGKDTCYPLVFGLPAFLNLFGITAFIVGKPFYKIFPVTDKILVSVFKCIGYAMKKAITNKTEKKEHWLQYAEDQFDKSLISDIRMLFHVFQVYIPVPFFFTLYFQVGSTWVLQASKMDGEVLGYLIQPDQMVLLFPILLVAFIPTFEFALYPLLNKLGMLQTHLQKMGTGGVLNGLAFVMAGFVQRYIEGDLSVQPKAGFSELTIVNNSPCQITVDDALLKAFETKTIRDLPLRQENTWYITPFNCSATEKLSKSFRPETQFELMMITLDNDIFQVLVQNDSRIKLKTGNPRIRLFFRTDFEFTIDDKISCFLIRGEGSVVKIIPDFDTRPSRTGTSEYFDVKPGDYQIYLSVNSTSPQEQPLGEWKFKRGGSYVVEIYQDLSENESKLTVFPTLQWNSIPILLQLPQYVTISAGSIMFIITGLAFSYSEAPMPMKAVVQAVWYLTYAFGNILLLIMKPFIYLLRSSNQLFAFGIFMLLDMVIFLIIAHFYAYSSDENKRQ